MTCKIVNKTDQDLGQLTQMAQDLYPYSQKRLGFDKPVMVEFHSDTQNANNILGKTAYYDPSSYKVVVYVDGRHPKDVLRSFSHELVHHAQNCRGEFDDHMKVGEGYAQKDKHLREMEKEAYLEGNMILRDWEDKKKEKPKMDEQKVREITRRILEKLEEKRVEERTKRDSADRVAGRDAGGRRLKPLEEEENLEESYECGPDGTMDPSTGDCHYPHGHPKNKPQTEGKLPPALQAAIDKKNGDDKGDEEEEETLEEHSEEVEMHDCSATHGDTPHADWAQQQGVGPTAHMGIKENKGADQLHNERLYENLIKKWCK
tara:strand:+ start:1342 stop:2292 length:951 start_codon:yes stop_codon:yes gene_type:complete